MIQWTDLIGPFILFGLAIFLIFSIGVAMRRKYRKEPEPEVVEEVDPLELPNFLLAKIDEDLAESDSRTRPLLEAQRKLVEMSIRREIDLRPIAEVYRYRRGFNRAWIGE